MTSKVENITNNTVKLNMNFDASTFKKAMEKAYKKRAGGFRIPGFRKGKAPMNLALRYYGEGVLYEDAIDSILADNYSKAVEEHSLEPVARPELNVNNIGISKGLDIDLIIAVKPDVKIGDYKGIEVPKEDAKVTDEDVENELKRIQERNSRMVAVDDRPVKKGDTVTISYTGTVDGVEFEGGHSDRYDLVIGSGTFIPGFEDALIGRNSGEDYSIDLTFPDDYHSDDLKGKAAVFTGHIEAVKYKELPELDDEFAKDVSEFDTLEEYKADLKKGLEENKEKAVQSDFERRALEKAAEISEMDIPDAMINEECHEQMHRQMDQMQNYGISPEQYLKMTGKSESELEASLKPQVTKNIRESLVLEAIGKNENIKADETEIEAEMTKWIDSYGMKKEEMDEDLKTRLRNAAENALVQQKVLRFIADHVKAVDMPIEDEKKSDDKDADTEENKSN